MQKKSFQIFQMEFFSNSTSFLLKKSYIPSNIAPLVTVWENSCVPVTDQSKVSYDSYIHTELILGLKTLGTIAVLRGMGLICYFTALKYYWY